MNRIASQPLLILRITTLLVMSVILPARADEYRGSGCVVDDPFFTDEVWAKVIERNCLECHREDGEASDSQLVLYPLVGQHDDTPSAIRRNHAALRSLALRVDDGTPRLLAKAVGQLEHGGDQVLTTDSTEYQILARFVDRVSEPTYDPTSDAPPSVAEVIDFFDGVTRLSPKRHLRRVTLSLAGRLPTNEELAAIESAQPQALDTMLDRIMQEDAFYDRLHEGFNDILLTRGYDDVPETVYSYEHFENTRFWTRDHDFSHLPEDERQQAKYALDRVYREAILREPYELIEYIVRNDRPFTEIVTADYLMVSPYTARGYGIFEDLKSRFQDPDDPYEFIPARLPALKHRNGGVQRSKTGYYPHAGLLTTFHYVRRYPTTDTNRNRLRARMFFQHFLGIDIMELAPRVTDAAAVDAKYAVPTMQAPDCVVCHRTIDPIAGLYKDYNADGHFLPRREAWYRDMFPPGWEADEIPMEERWRSLQWLGARTASDPRFATAMAEHAYYLLMGRRPLTAPRDIDHPDFAARRRAYRAQRAAIAEVAEAFVASDFNFKVALKQWIMSDWYRADGLATIALQPARRVELDDVGVVRLLTPEQLERKIAAIFAQPWGKLTPGDSRLDILYGGIDSREVTERLVDPSGAMGAIQRIMSNDVACRNVAWDFTTPASERRLFPQIEPDTQPGKDETTDELIRATIVHLHWQVLGREDRDDSADVDRTFQLFVNVINDARSRSDLDQREIWFCRGRDDRRLDDPHYTLRGWRTVVTYLLRRHEFLYE